MFFAIADPVRKLTHAGNAIGSPELLNAVAQALPDGARAPRAIERSDTVQREMRPALSEMRDLTYAPV